jgi:hypothetical protein
MCWTVFIFPLLCPENTDSLILVLTYRNCTLHKKKEKHFLGAPSHLYLSVTPAFDLPSSHLQLPVFCNYSNLLTGIQTLELQPSSQLSLHLSLVSSTYQLYLDVDALPCNGGPPVLVKSLMWEISINEIAPDHHGRIQSLQRKATFQWLGFSG